MQIEEAGSLRKHKSEEKRMFLQARRPEGVIRKACLKGLCHGSPVHFVLFCQLLALDRYGPMELKVGKEITCK